MNFQTIKTHFMETIQEVALMPRIKNKTPSLKAVITQGSIKFPN